MTRRGLLGCAAALPVVAAHPAVASARRGRSTWDNAVRQFEAAEAVSTEYDRARLDPAYAAHKAGKTPYPPLGWMAELDDGREHWFKFCPNDVRHHAATRPDSIIGEHAAKLLPHVEAADAANEALSKRLDLDTICDESERLGEAAWALRDELALIAAPDLAALGYKFRMLVRFDMFGDGFAAGAPQRSIEADFARLIGN